MVIFIQGAIFQGLVNRFKEFRRDKTKPAVKSATAVSKGKSPGITKQVSIPAVQVCVNSESAYTVIHFRYLSL